MAITSSDVNPGDDALAAQYNNLRADLLTEDVTLAGVKTFSGIPVFGAGVTISDDSNIQTLKKLYFGDAYIAESASNILRVYTNNTIRLTIQSDGDVKVHEDLVLDATKELYLDGDAGHTKIAESSDNVVDYTIGGNIMMRMDANGIAPGDNESMMWDVVIFALDGTSSDTVGYTVDENKIYGMFSTGHATATTVYTTTDAAINVYTWVKLLANVLEISYGAGYGAADAAQVIIFYIN